MRKIVICLTVLFLCIFGAITVGKERTETEKVTEAVKTTDAETEKVLLFTDKGEKTEEVAEAVMDKVQAVYVDEKKLEEKELNMFLRDADLVLIGMEETNTEYMADLKELLRLDAMEGNRVSFYMIGKAEAVLERLEKEVAEEFQAVNLLPCFLLSWEENLREDELARMNGWLTTAFTY